MRSSMNYGSLNCSTRAVTCHRKPKWRERASHKCQLFSTCIVANFRTISDPSSSLSASFTDGSCLPLSTKEICSTKLSSMFLTPLANDRFVVLVGIHICRFHCGRSSIVLLLLKTFFVIGFLVWYGSLQWPLHVQVKTLSTSFGLIEITTQ